MTGNIRATGRPVRSSSATTPSRSWKPKVNSCMTRKVGATWTASTTWRMVNTHSYQSCHIVRWEVWPCCHPNPWLSCGVTTCKLLAIFNFSTQPLIICFVLTLNHIFCLPSGPLPPCRGEGRSRADGNSQHKLTLPARQPGRVRPAPAVHTARQVVCVLLCQLRVRLTSNNMSRCLGGVACCFLVHHMGVGVGSVIHSQHSVSRKRFDSDKLRWAENYQSQGNKWAKL